MEQPNPNGRVHGHVSYERGPSKPEISFHTGVRVHYSGQNYILRGPIPINIEYIQKFYPGLYKRMESLGSGAVPISLPEKEARTIAERFVAYQEKQGEKIALDTLIEKSSPSNQDSQYALND